MHWTAPDNHPSCSEGDLGDATMGEDEVAAMNEVNTHEQPRIAVSSPPSATTVVTVKLVPLLLSALSSQSAHSSLADTSSGGQASSGGAGGVGVRRSMSRHSGGAECGTSH